MISLPVSRRHFLVGAGATCAAGALAPAVRPQLAFAADGVARHALVLILLEGGLDGISALVPEGDPAYAKHRRATFVPDGSVRAVDAMFGLHPSLAPIADLWADGLVAAVPAVGTATQTRSHFAEMAVVAAGAPGGTPDGSGWVARHLLTLSGGQPITLHGVSCGAQPSLELTGHPGAFHVPYLASAGLGGWAPGQQAAAEQALADAYAAAPPALARPAATAFDALAKLRSSVAAAGDAPASQDVDPWAAQLRQVAQLIRADIGMEAAVVSLPGWDTHSFQGGTDGQLARLLGRLARGISSFATDLADRLADITVVVLSEFGRRAQENGSGGTDHGRGGLALVLGRGIVGGVHGTWPGLGELELDRGDVAVTTDVRSVLAEVVRGRLGNPALDQVFPGFVPVPLGIA